MRIVLTQPFKPQRIYTVEEPADIPPMKHTNINFGRVPPEALPQEGRGRLGFAIGLAVGFFGMLALYWWVF